MVSNTSCLGVLELGIGNPIQYCVFLKASAPRCPRFRPAPLRIGSNRHSSVSLDPRLSISPSRLSRAPRRPFVGAAPPPRSRVGEWRRRPSCASVIESHNPPYLRRWAAPPPRSRPRAVAQSWRQKIHPRLGVLMADGRRALLPRGWRQRVAFCGEVGATRGSFAPETAFSGEVSGALLKSDATIWYPNINQHKSVLSGFFDSIYQSHLHPNNGFDIGT